MRKREGGGGEGRVEGDVVGVCGYGPRQSVFFGEVLV